MQSIKLTLPLKLTLPRKLRKDRIIHLSVNAWELLHFQVKQEVKNAFADLITKQLWQLQGPTTPYPSCNLITLDLWTSHQNLDLRNFCNVIEKITTDNVVRAGYLPDDKVKYIQSYKDNYKGIDKLNPRLEITYEFDNIT